VARKRWQMFYAGGDRRVSWMGQVSAEGPGYSNPPLQRREKDSHITLGLLSAPGNPTAHCKGP